MTLTINVLILYYYLRPIEVMKNMKKKTKIICSIGPASDSVEVMSEMVNNGMDCARINLSHATQEDILKTIEVIKESA